MTSALDELRANIQVLEADPDLAAFLKQRQVEEKRLQLEAAYWIEAREQRIRKRRARRETTAFGRLLNRLGL